MILSVEEKQALLSKFPSFKLCYENIAHNKVAPGGFSVAIPKGPKCFVWFSLHSGNPACVLIERGRMRDTISDISIIPASFSPTIVGTVLSGTIAQSVATKRVLVLDDVYFYKNRHVGHMMPAEKVRILGGLFVERSIVNTIELKTQFMMAQMGPNIVPTTAAMYCIQQRKDNRTPYMNTIIKQHQLQSEPRKVFKVTAETQNDIYTLYDEHDVDCGLACIQTYETSKMMNSLFRNIKENRCLDALEESDDEEEFENISLDKFIIDKSRVIKMECEYVPQFKKWLPIKMVNS